MDIKEVPEIPQELLTQLREACTNARWINAKTYPDHMAHAYVLEKEHPDLVHALDAAIKQYGYTKLFYGQPNQYLELGDGYKYWGWGILINRERLELTRARELRGE